MNRSRTLLFLLPVFSTSGAPDASELCPGGPLSCAPGPTGRRLTVTVCGLDGYKSLDVSQISDNLHFIQRGDLLAAQDHFSAESRAHGASVTSAYTV